jgi:hypothetical protein
MPSINYTLKGIVERMRGSSVLTNLPNPTNPTNPPAPISENPNRPTVSAKRVAGTNQIHIQVSTGGDLTSAVPVDYYFLNDRSGSMEYRASKPIASTTLEVVMDENVADAAEFSRNQLTDFALNVCDIMDEKHRMGIVVFDTSADVVLGPTKMDDAGKALVKQKLPLPAPRGGTDYWVGIRTTLGLLKQNYRPGALSVIFLLTDGATDQSRIPVGGFGCAIEDWKEDNPDIKFMINTIGFGYGPSVDMNTLSSIARATDGMVSYIPDGGFVCPVFTHLVSNLGSCQHVDQHLTLEPAPGVRLSKTSIPVKILQSGPPRDFYVEMTSPPPGCDVSILLTATIAGESFEIPQDIPSEEPDGLFLRDSISSLLEKSILKQILDVSGFYQVRSHITKEDELFHAILDDFVHEDPYKGQISKSFNPGNWKNWGYHYILSILDGYRHQIRVNDKDAVGALYALGSPTEKLIKAGTRLLRTLTLPEGIYSARRTREVYGTALPQGYTPRTMTLSPSGPCFTGDGLVLMHDGRQKRVDAIRKGDNVAGGHTVLCVLKTITGGYADIVRLGSVGGWTPTHPVCVGDIWFLPCDITPDRTESCDAVYNFVLGSGHYLYIGIMKTCTIGHDFTGPVIEHPYFGARRPNCHTMLDDLEASPNYSSGLVIWGDVSIQRDADGYVCKMTPGFQG